MGTTSLIVELVIIGFQVTVWLFFILLSIWGYEWINLTSIKDWSAAITLTIIAISYSLGIIFDGIVGTFFSSGGTSTSKQVAEIIKKQNKDSGGFEFVPPAKMRAYILSTNSALSEKLDQMRNQHKLYIATSINLALIGISAIIFVAARIGFTWKSIETILLILLPLVFIISRKWWQRAYATYYYELGMIYLSLKNKVN